MISVQNFRVAARSSVLIAMWNRPWTVASGRLVGLAVMRSSPQLVLFCRGDHRDQAAAVRALVLGAAGHEDAAIADHAGHEAGDGAADVALGIDVGIVEHGVAMSPDPAAPIRLAFDQHRGDP